MKLEWKTCLKVGLSIFILYVCINYWEKAAEAAALFIGAAMPLFTGCIIAYIVNILMSCYERHYFPRFDKSAIIKSRRPVCMLAAFVTVLAVVFLVVRLIVPQLVSCFQIILAELPYYLTKAVNKIEDLGILPENIISMLDGIDWRSRIGDIAKILTSGLGSVMDIVITTVSSVFSWIVSTVLGLIFSIYLLAGKEKLGSQFKRITHRYLKDSWCKKIWYVLDTANTCFHKYIVGQCTEAVILGALCAIGMLILRLPYATMIGALVGFTALIPVAGAYIGAGVGAFMILTVSPVKAVVFLVFIVVLQQLEGNIIYPKVVGSSMGLPGIWVLAAVTVGGGVMGIPGMLLGVPLVATAYKLIRDDVNKITVSGNV
ncbi:MAG: AI-2E family transporter [Ruminococcaceae bacterium]|nr:AI-2E family transporter [Oscillospiraceae bacterium]